MNCLTGPFKKINMKVICKKNKYNTIILHHFTICKIYEVEIVNLGYSTINDVGEWVCVTMPERTFRTLSEHRNILIDEILKDEH